MTPAEPATDGRRLLQPYFPRLQLRWHDDHPERRHLVVDGSLLFLDVSGFTRMSERLSRLGNIGSEEVADVISTAFSELLAVAYELGGSNLKFGGDALLLLFEGPAHPDRAATAAIAIRRRLREISPLATSAGKVPLRLSAGLHSGTIDFFLVGGVHRELIVAGPAATATVGMESTAGAGVIVMSPDTADRLPRRAAGLASGGGLVLLDHLDPVDPAPAIAHVPDRDPASMLAADLASAIVDGNAAAQHRPTAIAFVGFSGFDALMTRDPDAATNALEALVTDVQVAAQRYEVCFLASDIDRDGGKIILTAGVPRQRGNDAERLVLAVREALIPDRALNLRAGIHRGHVFAGPIGPPYRRTYTVMGDAVNLTARVMSKAEHGSLLATTEVLTASRTLFRTDAVPPFLVKGKRRPVEAVVVGDPLGIRAHIETDLPIVGRGSELATLRALADQAAAGLGGLAAVTGEAGIGKSRLVAEVAADFEGRTLQAACSPYFEHVPYYPIRTLVHGLLGTHGDDSVQAALEARAPHLSASAPLVALAAGITSEDEFEHDLSEEARKYRLEQAVVDLVHATVRHPTLFVVEDAHWIDRPSLDLLARLSAQLEEIPLLVVLARRDREMAAELAGVSVELEPLTRSESERLVDLATDHRPLAPHRRDGVVTRAAGHPLLLLELARAAMAGADLDSLPSSVEDLITARIDGLPERERAALLALSVLGPRFPSSLQQVIRGEEANVPAEALSDFVTVGSDECGFRDPLAQQVAYQALPYSRRRALHARVAEILERAPAPEPAVLSYHHANAGQHRPAWEWSLRAGDAARSVFANIEAATFYQRALRAARRLDDVADGEMREVADRLGEVNERAGLFPEAATAYATARRLAGDPVSEAASVLKLGRLATREARYPAALRWYRRGLDLVGGVDTTAATALDAALSVEVAATREAQGHHGEAERWARRAIDGAAASGDLGVRAHAEMILDWAETEAGHPDGHRHALAALELYRELDDLHGQALSHLNLGAYAYYDGKWTDAVAHYEQSRAIWTRTGNPVGAAMAAANIAEIRVGQRRPAEARELFAEALPVFRASGDRATVAFVLSHLGRIAATEGDFDTARRHFEQARSGLEHSAAHNDLLTLDLREAEALVLEHRHETAERVTGDALQRARTLKVEGLLVPALERVRGEALAAQGKVDDARRWLLRSLEGARAQQSPADIGLALEAMLRLEHDPDGSARMAAEWDAIRRGLDIDGEGGDELASLP